MIEWITDFTFEETIDLAQKIQAIKKTVSEEPVLIKEFAPNLEKIQAIAHNQGFEAGEKATLEQQLKQENQLQQNLTHQIEQMQQLFNGINLAINNNRLLLKQEIADIVMAIIAQLFIQQAQASESIYQQIDFALSHLNQQHTIKLYLHPQDLRLLKQSSALESRYSTLTIQTDDSLTLGGCLIKSEHGIFDASIEQQIDRLKAVLIEIKNQAE